MADSSGDKTIKELTQIQSVAKADTIPVWDDSAQGNNTLKMPVGMLESYLNDKLNTFQPGDTYGGGLTGYSFQVLGQAFSNNAQFTLMLPKSIKNRTISYSAGNIVNIICNGSSTNVISQTPTIVKVNDYAIRLQFTGSFTNHRPAILQMNSNIVFN